MYIKIFFETNKALELVFIFGVYIPLYKQNMNLLFIDLANLTVKSHKIYQDVSKISAIPKIDLQKTRVEDVYPFIQDLPDKLPKK